MLDYKFQISQLYDGFSTPQECLFFSYFSRKRNHGKVALQAQSLKEPLCYLEDGKDTIVTFVDTYFESSEPTMDLYDVWMRKTESGDVVLMPNRDTKTYTVFNYKNKSHDGSQSLYGYKTVNINLTRAKLYFEDITSDKQGESWYKLKDNVRQDFITDYMRIVSNLKTKTLILTGYGGVTQSFKKVEGKKSNVPAKKKPEMEFSGWEHGKTFVNLEEIEKRPSFKDISDKTGGLFGKGKDDKIKDNYRAEIDKLRDILSRYFDDYTLNVLEDVPKVLDLAGDDASNDKTLRGLWHKFMESTIEKSKVLDEIDKYMRENYFPKHLAILINKVFAISGRTIEFKTPQKIDKLLEKLNGIVGNVTKDIDDQMTHLLELSITIPIAFTAMEIVIKKVGSLFKKEVDRLEAERALIEQDKKKDELQKTGGDKGIGTKAGKRTSDKQSVRKMKVKKIDIEDDSETEGDAK